jgi:hypothetical protein
MDYGIHFWLAMYWSVLSLKLMLVAVACTVAAVWLFGYCAYDYVRELWAIWKTRRR